MAERVSRGGRPGRRTGMTNSMTNEKTAPEIEALALELSAHTAPDDATWQRLRTRVAAGALADGILDVAFERHDSPLGRIVLGATDVGVVRVGLPAEDEDAVLDELAARVPPRVLRAPRAALHDARRSSTSTSPDAVAPSSCRSTGA